VRRARQFRGAPRPARPQPRDGLQRAQPGPQRRARTPGRLHRGGVDLGSLGYHSLARRDARRGAPGPGVERTLWDRGADPRAREVPPGRRCRGRRRLGRRGRGARRRRSPGHRLRLRRLFRSRQSGRGVAPHSRAARARTIPGADPGVARGGAGRAQRHRRDGRADGGLARVVEDRAGAHGPPDRSQASHGALEAPADLGVAGPPSRSRSAPPRAHGGARCHPRRGHRPVAHRPDPDRAPGGDRRGAHRSLLHRLGVLGRATARRGRAGFGPSAALPAAGRALGVAHPGLVDRR
jgi:hypothetical protein